MDKYPQHSLNAIPALASYYSKSHICISYSISSVQLIIPNDLLILTHLNTEKKQEIDEPKSIYCLFYVPLLEETDFISL